MAGEQRHTGAPRPAVSPAAPSAPPAARADQGWGRPKGPTEEQRCIQLADLLAAAVRTWEANPITRNYYRMLDACSAYEKTLR